MSEIKYQLSKFKTNMIVKLWWIVPRSWVYYAVINAWARATTERYTNKTPNEITWDMVCRHLERK